MVVLTHSVVVCHILLSISREIYFPSEVIGRGKEVEVALLTAELFSEKQSGGVGIRRLFSDKRGVEISIS
jgi:hypothetical protein